MPSHFSRFSSPIGNPADSRNIFSIFAIRETGRWVGLNLLITRNSTRFLITIRSRQNFLCSQQFPHIFSIKIITSIQLPSLRDILPILSLKIARELGTTVYNLRIYLNLPKRMSKLIMIFDLCRCKEPCPNHTCTTSHFTETKFGAR